jgi:hypothetical protein
MRGTRVRRIGASVAVVVAAAFAIAQPPGAVRNEGIKERLSEVEVKKRQVMIDV